MKDTPFRAWTRLVCRPRLRTPRWTSAPLARLPVASTLYSTWTSSTMTAGLGELVDSSIALLRSPEEDRTQHHHGQRPHRGIEPELRLDREAWLIEQHRSAKCQELVDRLELHDAERGGILGEGQLHAEEDPRRVEENASDERKQLGQVPEMHGQACRD